MVQNIALLQISRLRISVTVYSGWGGVKILNCRLAGCVDAVSTVPSDGLEILSTSFNNNTQYEITAYSPGLNVVVDNCEFNSPGSGISVIGISDMSVTNCNFVGHLVGVQYHSTWGVISGCRFTSISNVNVALINSDVTMNDNILTVAEMSMNVNSTSELFGAGNVLHGGVYMTMRVSSSVVDFHGNHILNHSGDTISLVGFGDEPPDTLSFSNNYWGTSNADSISSWIWDGRDDPGIHAYVNFEPFSAVPLPSEQKSMGDVKRMFR